MAEQPKAPIPIEVGNIPSFKTPVADQLKNTAKFVIPSAVALGQSFLFRAEDVPTEQSDINSYLGSAIFAQVVIQGGRYFELEDIEGENPIDYEGIVMQMVLLDVSLSKNIVKTSIQGRNTTVKEFISNGDFLITITGNIMGQTSGNTIEDIGPIYPEIDTKRIIEIAKIPDVITVESKFLQMFGINDIVITDAKFAEKAGFRDQQPFQLTAISDVPIQLEELANE